MFQFCVVALVLRFNFELCAVGLSYVFQFRVLCCGIGFGVLGFVFGRLYFTKNFYLLFY